MPTAALTPRVRMMAICDRVRESRIEAGVFDLKGVRQEIRTPAFPFVPRRLALFLVLSSPRPGEFPCYVRVVNDKTDRVVYHSHVEPNPIFASDGGLFPWTGALSCRFPEEGWYSLQIWFFQEEGHDILKGEMIFHVGTESS